MEKLIKITKVVSALVALGGMSIFAGLSFMFFCYSVLSISVDPMAALITFYLAMGFFSALSMVGVVALLYKLINLGRKSNEQ